MAEGLGTAATEAAAVVLGTAVSGLWAFLKASDWWRQGREQRLDRALQALEAGVEKTYRTYVRAIKQGRADGKLTEQERRQARLLARDTAVAFGRTDGVDVVRELGHHYVDLWIARLVARLRA